MEGVKLMTTAQMRWKIVIMNFFFERERKKLKKKERSAPDIGVA